MNENENSNQSIAAKNNILFAVILALIALSVGVMPFFYFDNMPL